MSSTSDVSTCLPTATSTVTIPSPSQLSAAVPASFVTRDGTRLVLDGNSYKAVGPNIYWLGLDENVVPNPSWPSRERVLEVFAVAATMGANTVRSTTLGISVGTALSVEKSLGVFNQDAFMAIDWAVWAAKSYGIRLILPLTDQYDYYHGGIPTFLRWRNLTASSPSDYGPFYDINGVVFQDFKLYISNLINHRSNITGLTMAEEPAILAFETGNELGGWGLGGSPPPVDWTAAVASYLKELAPNTLVLSGSYGVREIELNIPEVDIYSDHYYPPYSHNLKRGSSLATSHNKAFLVGEFDWTNKWYKTIIYVAVLIPIVVATGLWLLPGRWWPWRLSCCCRKRRTKTAQKIHAVGSGEYASTVSPSTPSRTPSSSSLAPPLLEMYPPSPSNQKYTLLSSSRRRTTCPQSFLLQRYHLALLIVVVFLPIIAGIISIFIPTPLHSFLSTIENLASSNQLAGSFYWSLFGKDNSCCDYVQHNDGYTLHYPSNPSGTGVGVGSGESVVELTRHAWNLREMSPTWFGNGVDLNKLGLGELPGVGCPQAALAVPVNATWAGGNGTLGT